MALLRAEHVGDQVEIGYSLRNDLGGVAGDVNAIIIHAVDIEAIQARAGASNRATFPQHACTLSCRIGSQNGQIQRRSSQARIRKIGDRAPAEVIAELRGIKLHCLGSAGDLHRRGFGTDCHFGVSSYRLVRQNFHIRARVLSKITGLDCNGVGTDS